MNSVDRDLLDNLCAQIEMNWFSTQKTDIVDSLAAANPSLSGELYDFASLLVEQKVFAATQPLKSQTPVSFLRLLVQRTGQKATEIAAQLQISYAFLVLVQRNPEVVPYSVRQEIAARAAKTFSFDFTEIIHSLSTPFSEAIAASRDKAYSARSLTFPQIVKAAKLPANEAKYWMTLAENEDKSSAQNIENK